MSSANKRNNGSLEDAFRHRMQDAEATPAPDLWGRIDHDLTVQENVQFKKRVVFYRQLAAACFVLFVMAGAVLIYQYKQKGEMQALAVQDQIKKDNLTESAQIARATTPASGTPKANGESSVTKQKITESELNVNDRAGKARVSIANEQTKVIAMEQNGGIASKGSGADKQETETIAAGSLATIALPENNAATPAVTQPASTTGILPAQPAILQSPTIMSLMAKNQNKLAEMTTDQQKQAEALALDLNGDKKAGKKSEKDLSESKWNMSMAYTPTYFTQNIGLPDKMMSSVRGFSIARHGPSISAETSANMEKARDEYENNTAPAFSYAVDVKTGFKLGKKLRLLAGLGFSKNTARTNTSYVVEQFWTNPKTNEKVELTPSTIFLPALNNSFSTDSISVSQTKPFSVDYQYRMFSFPVGLQFADEIANGWKWYITSGVAANLLVQTSVSATRNDIVSVTYEDEEDSPFRRTQFSGNVGLGVNKQVSDAISVSLGPEFRGFFNTMLAEPDKAVATQGKPYAIGLNMSLNYQLGASDK